MTYSCQCFVAGYMTGYHNASQMASELECLHVDSDTNDLYIILSYYHVHVQHPCAFKRQVHTFQVHYSISASCWRTFSWQIAVSTTPGFCRISAWKHNIRITDDWFGQTQILFVYILNRHAQLILIII